MGSELLANDERIMFLDRNRVLYFGLLGQPSIRELGAIVVYCSLGNPFQLQLGSQQCKKVLFAALPPYTPHKISSPDRLVGLLLIEPESVDPERLDFLRPDDGGSQALNAVGQRIFALYSTIANGWLKREFEFSNLDEAVFGNPLGPRKFDDRIQRVIDQIVDQRCGQFSAEACALSVGLSFSRFLHLFRDEVGTTFRRFRAWKRARSLLDYVSLQPNLMDIALETGYADASHFSHSIRQIYGLKPREIFAGSRHLDVRSIGESRPEKVNDYLQPAMSFANM